MCGERGGSIVESSSAFWRDQNPGPWLRMAANNTRLANTPSFLRQFKLSVVLLSVLLVLPCVWHRRIEAGDLASHVYNAWLAQLIEKGQAPGLYLSNQWNNVLFDVALLRAAGILGPCPILEIGLALTFCECGFSIGHGTSRVIGSTA